MPYLLVRHKVKDYLLWKLEFVEHAGTRKATGSLGGMLFQSLDDPNEIVVLMQWEDLASARAFMASAELREAMERAGVLGKPDVVFLEKLEQPSR